MDADRFDLLARSLVTPSRRAVSQMVAGLGLTGGLGTLLDLPDADAKKRKRKKKKKKCKGNKKKCGKKCIPKSACCPACGSDQTCQNGTCVCPEGTNICGDTCVEGDECCSDGDCAGVLSCLNGFCDCRVQCGPNLCCNPEDDEVCVVIANPNSTTCQAGGCPETDYCSDLETYVCGPTCSCVTTLDPNPAQACAVDPVAQPPAVCTTCASSNDCGADEVCIPNGVFCACDDTPFCVSRCEV